ncbi:alpha/beta fold hydrolase [Arcobacter sp. LA11]|uniref:alpha/beta fold hydrolase n=1 Tax=Arcobacter sp. LA11 TaxID=1898176 RepID=UPI000934BAC4|nr:alpha/beta hydrolase [Arcobacter sp. LA11]
MAELNYKKIGNGSQTVIIMHEWMGDHTNYDATVPYLDTEKHTFIFVDFRGYGLSKDIEGKFDLFEACNDIKNLILKLRLNKFHLLGHSMSSLIAQRIALDLQEQVKTLILITPIPPIGIKMTPSAKEKLLTNVKEENGVIEQVVEGASKRYNKIWKDYRKELAHNCSTLEAKLGYMNMYLSNDFSEEIEGLETKVCIIVGKYDLPAFHKNTVQKQFVKYYPNLVLVECMEAGHYPMIECPVFFANQLEKFIG